MDHAHHLAPPPAAPPPRARALVSAAFSVTYPYLLGGGGGYLALTALSRDLSLMFAGALLVLYGAALAKALPGHGQTEARDERGADGAQ